MVGLTFTVELLVHFFSHSLCLSIFLSLSLSFILPLSLPVSNFLRLSLRLLVLLEDKGNGDKENEIYDERDTEKESSFREREFSQRKGVRSLSSYHSISSSLFP